MVERPEDEPTALTIEALMAFPQQAGKFNAKLVTGQADSDHAAQTDVSNVSETISKESSDLPAELGVHRETPFHFELAAIRVSEVDLRSKATHCLCVGGIEARVAGILRDPISKTSRTPRRQETTGVSLRINCGDFTRLCDGSLSRLDSLPGRVSPQGLDELAGPQVGRISTLKEG